MSVLRYTVRTHNNCYQINNIYINIYLLSLDGGSRSEGFVLNVNRCATESVPTGGDNTESSSGGTADNVDVDDEDDLRLIDNWGGELSFVCRRCDVVLGE